MPVAVRAAKGYQVSLVEDSLVMQIRWSKLPAPEREYHFHPVRKWRFDLAWPDRNLAVEVQGATWVAGYHNRGKGYELDCVKYNEAVLLGWRVLTVTSAMVDDGRALDVITRALRGGPA
jgi:hypothetical protein